MAGKERAQAAEQARPRSLIRDAGWRDPPGHNQPQRVDEDVALAPLDQLVAVEATHTAALGRLHGLAVHDDERGTRLAPGGQACLPI